MIQIVYLKDLVQLHSKLLLRLLLVIWLVFFWLLLTFFFSCYSFCGSRIYWTSSTRFLSMPLVWIYFSSGMCTDHALWEWQSSVHSVTASLWASSVMLIWWTWASSMLLVWWTRIPLGFACFWILSLPFSFLTSQIIVMLVGGLFHLGLRIFFSPPS